jgi:uncharacterized membrane protein YdbT with pleckstrin-like domain
MHNKKLQFRFFPASLLIVSTLTIGISIFISWVIINLNLGDITWKILMVYAMAVFITLFYGFLDWYLDTMYLDHENLIIVEWQGLFKKSVTEIELDRVETVKVITPLTGNILKYGHVEIITTSHEFNVNLRYIFNADNFKAVVLQAVKDMKNKNHLNESNNQ